MTTNATEDVDVYFLDQPCSIVSYMADKESEIDLKGDLGEVQKSSFTPFQVLKSELFLNIIYLDNLTNISIDILDEMGYFVYSRKVNPVYGEQLLINILSWRKGMYTIKIFNASCNYLCGNFDL